MKYKYLCGYPLIENKTYNFIERSKIIHDNKFDYSKVYYINNRTPVIIICPVHGEFKQMPVYHLRGNGCLECSGKKKSTTSSFVRKSNVIHNNFYDYSNVEYKNAFTPVSIICPVHGEFLQKPNSHLDGRGCNLCGRIKTISSQSMSLNDFLKKAKEIHDDKFIYDDRFVNATTPISIHCRKHGSFLQKPYKHLSGQGCPICMESRGELMISDLLIRLKIKFEKNYVFNDCRYIKPLRFDFFLPDFNTCIEFDGIQHYQAREFFGGQVEFEKTVLRDNKKNEYCLKNNIKLLRIRDLSKIESEIKKILFEGE